MSLCLTYDVTHFQDGAGAQLQRIFAIESLSTLLGVGFSHHKIITIDSNYGDGLNTIGAKDAFVNELNQYVDFDEYSCPHLSHKEIKWRLPTRFQRYSIFALRIFKFFVVNTKQDFLLSIPNPVPFLRNSGNLYDLVRPRHGFTKENSSKELQVKIHLPWAGIGHGQLNDRRISLEWYRKILMVIDNELSANGYECTYTFHTDGIPGLKSDMISLGISSATQSYWRESGLLAENDFNWSYIDIPSEFRFLPNIQVRYGISPIEVWDDMITADILVLAQSSLSTVAGFLNLTALKIAPLELEGVPGDFNLVSTSDPDFTLILKSLLISKFDLH